MGPRMFIRGNAQREGRARQPVEASMGPRMFIRGNPLRSAYCGWHGPLQWGRGCSSAETLIYQQYGPLPEVASMGPRMFIRGNDEGTGGDITGFAQASMGPRMFIRGNLHPVYPSVGPLFASMGPRMFIRGNMIYRPLCADTGCFNGAADVHPRKLRGSCDVPNCGGCFNGAADVHPRKLGPASLCRRCRVASMGPRMFIRGNDLNAPDRVDGQISFNGAADVHPRKLDGIGRCADYPGQASMGPRMFIRGNGGWDLQTVRARPCFNGAADVHPRKPAERIKDKVARGASMGPRMFIRGNQTP